MERLAVERYSEARDLLDQAASAGSAEAAFQLGLAADGLNGDFLVGDARHAFSYYALAAEAGHAQAMLNLSFCFHAGEGMPRSVPSAFEWLLLAAAAGDGRAQYNAGVALDPLQPPWPPPARGAQLNARGAGALASEAAMGRDDAIAKEAERAVAFYREAAAADHPRAMVNLGVSLFTGSGCATDRRAAIALWERAAECGVEEAFQLLVLVANDVASDELARAQSRAFDGLP